MTTRIDYVRTYHLVIAAASTSGDISITSLPFGTYEDAEEAYASLDGASWLRITRAYAQNQ